MRIIINYDLKWREKARKVLGNEISAISQDL